MANRPRLLKIGAEMRRWCALLEEEMSTWPEVTSRPMFGMVAFYRGKNIFAAVPRTRAAETETSLLIKLPAVRAQRPRSSRGPGAGWVSFEMTAARDITAALRRLERAYEKARAAKGSCARCGLPTSTENR